MENWQALGIPTGLARDGWWLDGDNASAGLRSTKHSGGKRNAVAVIGLVALGDWLFWDQAGPGLSLALFILAIAAVLRGGRGWHLQQADGAIGLAILPLIERVQPLSVAFALLGLLGFAIHHREGLGLSRIAAILPGIVLRYLPTQALRAVPQAWRGIVAGVGGMSRRGGSIGDVCRAIALPLGLGLCFSALLVLANPILADVAARIFHLEIDPLRLIARGLFWAGLAIAIWPVLTLAKPGSALSLLGMPAVEMPQLGGMVNAGAVASSLWLFNTMFAVQTVLDMVFLWGGAALPAGTNHAEYAQRGAYPLVATALLAGAFALIARPYAAQRKIVRLLLLLWVGQNIALVISALSRLDSYVAAYGLTYLRSYAAIWMAMVAIGLILVAWQVLRGLPNIWLMLRSAVLGFGVLYGCCFVNFAGFIAHYNLTAWQTGSLAVKLDRPYLCRLGSDAWAEIARFDAGWNCDAGFNQSGHDDRYPFDFAQPHIEGWRDWSFRSWRVLKGAKGAYSGRG